jgi:hypothetical protein
MSFDDWWAGGVKLDGSDPRDLVNLEPRNRHNRCVFDGVFPCLSGVLSVIGDELHGCIQAAGNFFLHMGVV